MEKKKEIEQIENEVDYYIDQEGRFVFTEHYHLRRGYCCGNHCIHCPYDDQKGSHSLKK